MADLRYQMTSFIRGRKPEAVNDKARARYNSKAAKTKRTDDKTDAIQAAKELLYGPDIIERLENAKSNAEIERIMATARKRRLE